MKSPRFHLRAAVGLLVIMLWWLGGCIEYRIETELNADGSGTRSETVEVDENQGEERKVGDRQFVELMNVSEGDGWTYTVRRKGDDSVHVFRREARIDRLAGWDERTRSVHIAGTTPAHSGSRVGYVRLGDVHFWNDVSVEMNRSTDGTTYTYRETFYWVDALDALIEFLMGELRREVQSRYPGLSSDQTAEIVGLARGQIWAALDGGLLESDGPDSEELLESVIDRTASVAARIARQVPAADEEYFRTLLEDLLNDEDDRLGDFLGEKLPGFDLGPGFTFRLKMPGRVVSSNADERDGEALVWKFNAGDAMAVPVTLVAESVVSG